MHTELDQISLDWFKLVTATKVATDVMHQVPVMESSIVTAKISFVLWTNADVILSC